MIIFLPSKRYGDQINPWGDIIALARAWCQMKVGSKALIGVPAGKDKICFNAHRFYGSYMYPHLFANWKIIHTEGNLESLNQNADCREPNIDHAIHILQKLNTG